MDKKTKLSEAEHLACKLIAAHETIKACRKEADELVQQLGAAQAEVARLRRAVLDMQVRDAEREAQALRKDHDLPQNFTVTVVDGVPELKDMDATAPAVLEGGKTRR